MNRTQRKETKRVALAIYDCNREYGGHEEGGWWYDTGRRVERCGSFYNESNAYAACRRLNDWCEADNERNQRRPIYSVICTGVLQAHVMPAPAPHYFPAETPHYE